MKFSIKDFFRKYDQILRKLRICSHLLKKSLTENFIFCAMFPLSLVYIRAQSYMVAPKLTYTKLTLKHNLLLAFM